MKLTQLQTTWRFRLVPATVSLLLAASLLATSGCGGGGGSIPSTSVPGGVTVPSAGRGQVRFTIKWPEKAPTRVIPQAAESIRFICKDADDEDELIVEQVVPRGQTVVTLDLPSVRVRIDAEARSVADGSGQLLAKGGVTVQVKEAKVTSEKLTLDSVITQVKLSQTEIDLPANQSIEVHAEALDAEGAVVLTAPENWEWTPDDAGAADTVEFTPSGDRLGLSAKKDGTVAFTVREKESGHTARLTVTSHAPEEPDSRPRLTAHVEPGPNGEYRAVEVWVANELMGVCDSTKGLDIPFPLTLGPGRHYIWLKDVSNDPAVWYRFRAGAGIAGIGGVSGFVVKNDYLTDVFYIK